MGIEFDHLFVCTRVGAPDVDALVAFGLMEGTSNTPYSAKKPSARYFPSSWWIIP
jgi:hypothetical protein